MQFINFDDLAQCCCKYS